MTKKKDLKKDNYREMSKLNGEKMQKAYDLLVKHTETDIKLVDILEVAELAYEKNQTDKQVNEVINFFDFEGSNKVKFCIKNIINRFKCFKI